MRELEYPFDNSYILKHKKLLKRKLLEENNNYIEKKIALLGGSTTSDVKLILELFLLNYGIKAEFYESEYNKYWEDAMFDNEKLMEFKPDIIYIHTTNKNILEYPLITDKNSDVKAKLEREYERYSTMWNHLFETYNCTIIQNNFDYPTYRLLGNKDATDIRGKVNFLTRLNLKFGEYAEEHQNFFICDLNYISASYGLDAWADEFYYYMYKYALSVSAIPTLAYQIANIIKAILGKNKKALVLDLDNTLWGGVVGDDGVENLVIGPETPESQVYTDFQQYIKLHKDMGILLNVDSKNDEKNALDGLNHPDGILKPNDFIVIKANWEPKSSNLEEISKELNIGIDSFVFVDDNPAEREIIRQNFPNVGIPDLDSPYKYIKLIDHQGYFEGLNLSKEDYNKTEMYKENIERKKSMSSFKNYEDYLISLEMTSTIDEFTSNYMARIAQLTNKSNQFNLTTKRYTQAEIEDVAREQEYITLYGSLKDKFGDNGVVSVIIAHQKGEKLDIDLWIMSCRVLKRDMEYAMMDALQKEAKKRGVKEIYGYYYPTLKNGMVRDFYGLQGFEKIEEDEHRNTVWKFIVTDNYENKNKYIKVEDKNE